MTSRRRHVIALCEPEETIPTKHTTTVDFDGIIKLSVEYDPIQFQDYLEKCLRALLNERFPDNWKKVRLMVGLHDEHHAEDHHDLEAGLYCDVEGETPISLDAHAEASEPLWNKSPSRKNLSKNIAAKMESYIRCSLGDSAVHLIVREIRASEAACRTVDGRVSKKEFDHLSSIPPIALVSKRGGPHNVKIANQPKGVRRALGSEYVMLRDSLTNVIRDAKKYRRKNQKWRAHLVVDYPILEEYPDLLDEVDRANLGIPSDPDASKRVLAPWEIAIEIAARRTIPNYERFDASADTLKTHAILPEIKQT